MVLKGTGCMNHQTYKSPSMSGSSSIPLYYREDRENPRTMIATNSNNNKAPIPFNERVSLVVLMRKMATPSKRIQAAHMVLCSFS